MLGGVEPGAPGGGAGLDGDGAGLFLGKEEEEEEAEKKKSKGSDCDEQKRLDLSPPPRIEPFGTSDASPSLARR